MKRTMRGLGIAAGLIAILAFAMLALDDRALRVYQEGMTQELVEWEKKATPVVTLGDARQSVETMEYLKQHTAPRGSYRSDARTEAALAAQRARTLATYGKELEAYSGETFGADVECWRQWLDANTAK